MNRKWAIAAALIAAGAIPARAEHPHPIVDYSGVARFEDVRDDLKAAIEGRGLVIDYQANVNGMLERTGRDVGSTLKLYTNAMSFVFCSAVLSRKMMEAEPGNAALCPYSMTVYATSMEPDRVHVAFKRPWRPDGPAASQTALREVEALLEGIAREALQIK